MTAALAWLEKKKVWNYVLFLGCFTNTYFLSFNLLYLFLPLLSIYWFDKITKEAVINDRRFFMAGFLCGIFFLVSQTFVSQAPVHLFSTFIMGFSFFYPVMALRLYKNVTSDDLRILLSCSIRIVLIFYMAEFVTRVLNPIETQTGFYRLKGSLFFFDSNFVGLNLAIFFGFLLYLRQEGLPGITKYLFITFILIISTLSRASIFTAVCSFLIFTGSQRSLKYKLILGAALLTGLFIYLIISADMQNIDGSFRSKFIIILNAFNTYMHLPPANQLLGIGLNNTKLYLNVWSHNFLVMYILETGLAGFVVLLLAFYSWCRLTGWKALFVLGPFLINGFSLSTYFLAPVFILIAIIYVIEQNKAQHEDSVYDPLAQKLRAREGRERYDR